MLDVLHVPLKCMNKYYDTLKLYEAKYFIHTK